VLFTDADCWIKPDVIARALRVAARDRVEHIALTPGVAARTVPAQGWHVAFLISLAGWFAGVNQDKPKSYFGMGAFNLIDRLTYGRCGGHEALRLTVVDDVRLGLLVRRAGGRTRAFIGGDDVECQWGHTAREMVRLMEKNYFAALDYRTWAAVAAAIVWLLAGDRWAGGDRSVHGNGDGFRGTDGLADAGDTRVCLRATDRLGSERSHHDSVRVSSSLLRGHAVGFHNASAGWRALARHVLFTGGVARSWGEVS
jgi:hypothetical protein